MLVLLPHSCFREVGLVGVMCGRAGGCWSWQRAPFAATFIAIDPAVYRNSVRCPIDLRTVHQRLMCGDYGDNPARLANDVRMIRLNQRVLGEDAAARATTLFNEFEVRHAGVVASACCGVKSCRDSSLHPYIHTSATSIHPYIIHPT